MHLCFNLGCNTLAFVSRTSGTIKWKWECRTILGKTWSLSNLLIYLESFSLFYFDFNVQVILQNMRHLSCISQF